MHTQTSTCPLCGRPNACAMTAGDDEATDCWCMEIVIDADVLERIPEDLRDKACLCIDCASGQFPEDTELQHTSIH